MGRYLNGPNGKFIAFDSERQRLCEVVRVVARSLQRPVCADDVRAHVTTSPGDQPLLRQAIGQLLFKTVGRRGPLTMFRIGILGNRAYYAPSDNPIWMKRFRAYGARVVLAREIETDLPSLAIGLLSSSYERVARNALSGWLLLVTQQMAHKPGLGKEASAILADMRTEASKHAADKFAGLEPTDLIDRATTRQWLLDEMAVRVPWRVNLPGIRPNMNRYLAELRWPQCPLFGPQTQPLYWPEQIRAFLGARWPLKGDSPAEARAVLACLRFGPESPSKGTPNHL